MATWNCMCRRNLKYDVFSSLKTKCALLFKSLRLVVFFYVFEKKSLILTKAALFDQKYSKNCNTVKYYYNFKEVFYFNVLKCNLFVTQT